MQGKSQIPRTRAPSYSSDPHVCTSTLANMCTYSHTNTHAYRLAIKVNLLKEVKEPDRIRRDHETGRVQFALLRGLSCFKCFFLGGGLQVCEFERTNALCSKDSKKSPLIVCMFVCVSVCVSLCVCCKGKDWYTEK